MLLSRFALLARWDTNELFWNLNLNGDMEITNKEFLLSMMRMVEHNKQQELGVLLSVRTASPAHHFGGWVGGGVFARLPSLAQKALEIMKIYGFSSIFHEKFKIIMENR